MSKPLDLDAIRRDAERGSVPYMMTHEWEAHARPLLAEHLKRTLAEVDRLRERLAAAEAAPGRIVAALEAERGLAGGREEARVESPRFEFRQGEHYGLWRAADIAREVISEPRP
jgi:hypothetical protein